MRGRERKKERKRKRSQGDSPGLMFICGFISFTVWSSFTGRIISLSRSHIPPLRTHPPSLSAPSLSHSRQAIKILSATLLKNYGPLSSAFTLDFPRYSLSLTTIEYEHIELSLFISTSLHHSISSGSCLSALCPCRAAASTIRLLFRYSLHGSLFPL